MVILHQRSRRTWNSTKMEQEWKLWPPPNCPGSSEWFIFNPINYMIIPLFLYLPVSRIHTHSFFYGASHHTGRPFFHTHTHTTCIMSSSGSGVVVPDSIYEHYGILKFITTNTLSHVNKPPPPLGWRNELLWFPSAHHHHHHHHHYKQAKPVSTTATRSSGAGGLRNNLEHDLICENCPRRIVTRFLTHSLVRSLTHSLIKLIFQIEREICVLQLPQSHWIECNRK